MKNLFTLFLLVMLSSILFSSCEKDDENNKDNRNLLEKQVGLLDNNSGLRITGVKDWNFYYDSNGKIDYLENKEGRCNFAKDLSMATYKTEDSDGIYVQNIYYNINNKGYLSKIHYTIGSVYYENETKYELNIDGNYSITYNNNHITKIVESTNGSDLNTGETWTESEEISYAWNGDILEYIEFKNLDNPNKYEKHVFSYDKNENINKYMIYHPSMVALNDNTLEVFYYLGLMGKGSSSLPVSETTYYKDNGIIKPDNPNYFSHEINPNGTIAWIEMYNEKIYYKYNK